MKDNSTRTAVIEAIKEVARIAFFAAVAAVISYATTRLADLDPNSVYAVVGTVILRAVDKYIHENQNISAGGISPV